MLIKPEFKKISATPVMKTIKIDLPKNGGSFVLWEVLDYLDEIGIVLISDIYSGVYMDIDTETIDLNKLKDKLNNKFNCNIDRFKIVNEELCTY